MNLHFKTAAIILVTLIIGFVLGAITVPFLAGLRMRHFAGLRQPQGFVAFYENVIQPTEAQRDTVHAILLAHFDKIIQLAEDHREKLSELQQNLFDDLKSVLNKEQIKKLEKSPMRPGLLNRPFQGTIFGPHRGIRFHPMKPEVFKKQQ
jgi:hypothetical protein